MDTAIEIRTLPQPTQVDHGGAMLRPGQTFALTDGARESLSTRKPGAGESADNAALILSRIAWGGWCSRCGKRLRSAVNGASRRHDMPG